MRKYIHKFKNYTSVEVDNLHDLKEGDLALYEDKFLTRNNGKVEEVVKGGSSEEEYSTDYPDDFYIKYINASGFFEIALKDMKGKVEGSLIPSPRNANELYLFIPNLIDESVQLIYDVPEATYNGSPFDPTKYYMNPTGWVPAGINPRMIALSLSKIGRNSVRLAGNITLQEGSIPLTIKFKTTEGKAYKYTTKVPFDTRSTPVDLNVPANANYVHCEVKYLDLESEG